MIYNCIETDSCFDFADSHVFAPIDDIFCHPIEEMHSGRRCSLECSSPASRRAGCQTAMQIKELVGRGSDWTACPSQNFWDSAPVPNTDAPAAEPQNYFWNQRTSSSDSDSQCSRTETPVDSESDVHAFTIEVQWGGRQPSARPPRKAPKQRCRTNKKAHYWTPEDHAKFVAGLEQFGLQSGLGPGGAELMAQYMGNRSVLQIKSHFQKHMSDLVNGKSPKFPHRSSSA